MVNDMIMTNSHRIRIACTYVNISEAELARRLGTTPAAFNRRMKRNAFDEKDLEKICETLGAKYISQIKFPDGTQF